MGTPRAPRVTTTTNLGHEGAADVAAADDEAAGHAEEGHAATCGPQSWSCLPNSPDTDYDLIRAIRGAEWGSWTPSAGSIYPTLQALEDEGPARRIDTVDGRRTASLTPDGLAWVDEHADQHEGIFDADSVIDSAGAIRAELMGLRDAAMHVARRPGGGGLAASALGILAVAARKDMYRLLAEDEGLAASWARDGAPHIRRRRASLGSEARRLSCVPLASCAVGVG